MWLQKWEIWRYHERNTNIFARAKDGSHFYSTLINLKEIDKIALESDKYKSIHPPIMTPQEKENLITTIE